ncbi:hypothetical protein BST11_09780 [Mycobacterium alsense]|uniref:DUF2191 domain-containing protein n=1 Tax=Mycobacterium alsense TaxID=324058 RepID=A0AA42BZD4_9MYCO|nr:hypothetical protein [Mycobacterium alsense]MCV7379838.1 hypothetical protein [Mycobacterium alsense]OQZ91123.1 hypothetical protein BST11_09780 [Mycobacterium alsense]
MRTTVNIDAHLLAEAKVVAARTSRSLGAVLDDALRALLHRDTTTHRGLGQFRLPAHGNGGLQAGVDLEDKEALADIVGDNAGP